jgi:PAS domain S-box-containing protein
MKKIELLYQFSSQITTTTDPGRLYRTIMQFMKEMFELDFATLMLLADDKQQLTICDTVGFPESMIGTFSLVQGQGLSTHVVQTKCPAAVVDFKAETRFEVPLVVTRNNITSALCVPMMIEDEVFGVLIGHTLEKRIFTSGETTLFQNMGNLAAIAIKNVLNMQLLKKSRDEWEMTFNAVPELIMIIDSQYRTVRINRAMAENLAMQSAEAEGLHCYELMTRIGETCLLPACEEAASGSRKPAGDTNRVVEPVPAECPVAQLFRTGQGTTLVRTARSTSASRTFEITVSPVRDDNGAVIAAIKVMRDITDRKKAEADLQASEMRYRELIELSVGGILLGSSEGIIIGANSRSLEITGRSKEELIGKHISTIFKADSLRNTPLRFDLLQQGKTVVSIRDILRPDRSIVTIEMHTKRMPDGTYQSMYHDITRRRLAEEALQESEARLRVIFDTSQAGILQVEPNGTISFANKRMAEMFGMTLEELIGTSYLSHLHESEKAAGDDHMRRLIKGEIPSVSTERHYIRKNGTDFWGYLSGKPLEATDGSLIGLVGIIADITERKQAEAEQLELERRLLHAQKLESLGVLAGGIAHDFNNLLMAILGNLDMSLMKLSPLSAARPGIQAAMNASKRAAELTSQMLAYSGKGLFIVKDLNVNELVAENAHLLKAAISKTVTLSLQLGQNIPPVKADASQLQQVIMNLIINASEAIGDRPGVITLSTSVKECDAACLKSSRLEDKPTPGRFALLEVIDTGCGMDSETVQRLFDPFFSTKFTGRGLGMSAVLGIVKGHNGAIIVQSEEGKGTTMQVLLPLAEESQAEHCQASGTKEPGQEPHPAPLAGTVLVVDDEEVVREVCAAMIEDFGCRVITAVDGEDAMRILRDCAEKIDLVLMDLTMPRMDGSTAAREMIRIMPDIKVVLSSGYSEHELSLRFAGLGFAGFIQKPFNLHDLRDLLTRVLRSRG